MPKSVLHKTGAVCAALGAVSAFLLGTLLASAPPLPALSDTPRYLQRAAVWDGWVPLHWGLILSWTMILFGYAAAMLTLRAAAETRDAGGWGLTGLYVLILGTFAHIAFLTTEVALKPLANGLGSDPALLSGARALASLASSFYTASLIVFGLGLVLFGLALGVSKRYPRWIGASGITLGALMTLTIGFPRALMGSAPWTDALYPDLVDNLALLWTALLAIRLWRLAEAR
jgi:hypothetical protein